MANSDEDSNSYVPGVSGNMSPAMLREVARDNAALLASRAGSAAPDSASDKKRPEPEGPCDWCEYTRSSKRMRYDKLLLPDDPPLDDHQDLRAFERSCRTHAYTTLYHDIGDAHDLFSNCFDHLAPFPSPYEEAHFVLKLADRIKEAREREMMRRLARAGVNVECPSQTAYAVGKSA